MTKFLLFGPCRILSKNALFGGYGGLKFLIIFVNVLCTLLAKGLLLPMSSHSSFLGRAASIPHKHKGGAIRFTLIWIAFNLLPQLIYVSISHQILSKFLNYMINFHSLYYLIINSCPNQISGNHCVDQGFWIQKGIIHKLQISCNSSHAYFFSMDCWINWLHIILLQK